MNIEEARNVLCLKSNPRPLGELLNEGYLTKDRLEWAAKWAYNAKLKEAAKIILEWQKSNSSLEKPLEKNVNNQESPQKEALQIGITLDEARATHWPFPPYKGQAMGSLSESKQLSLKDLGYAIENAWDKKVRQAAIVLSLLRLEQTVKEPAPTAGFIHVILGGRSFANRRQSFLTFLEGFLLGVFFTFMLAMSAIAVMDTFKPHPNRRPLTEIVSNPVGILALITVLVGFILIIWLVNFIPDQISKRLQKQVEEYRRGEEGEERVVQLIVQALDGNWTLFRNIQIPGRNKGDLDIVLVGPPGVWVLEVKNFQGKYRNIGDRWEYFHSKKWTPAKGNPSQQAFNNAVRLGNFLKADHLKVFVNAVVVWANEESQLVFENPSTAIWTYSRLPDELGNIWQGEKLSESDREKIIGKLTKLCDEQKNKSAVEDKEQPR